ncbi:class I SAM-dependent methyltransferase [Halogeometricum borinquense]|uniref:Methylase involved in ubiquinone/menaquinone biosynthesis n=1 Tax=Halogeometricum borinquense (strain ATCC 700274 / DSM 11551 / JCM 10706 / KCTC 4070 / PR3) TaxID=469382 RepID=E4NLW4_HALBP|nr:class I SAM-dependent methyltransferase [Halogeometricum borinquense]ADQ68414.1 methylase involved in ubiquinone/menaquinone biosynthesis [Halogeometricum borinquense DSM 11551]ELY31376.1 methylase involved in ubiquinone/menaquinone biosynthesis [Halogeometricum borinquense DSM 11551]QIQ77581.1 class I SAM-dependent methyltransferase [Halogeometricum borinquense]
MTLRHVIEDINENPHRERDFYEYPALYDFYHSRMLDRDRQVNLLERYQPDDANRVLEFGCGTGPLLTRIEDEYEEVLGVDADERMLESARKHVSEADVLEADFTEWSAADDIRRRMCSPSVIRSERRRRKWGQCSTGGSTTRTRSQTPSTQRDSATWKLSTATGRQSSTP